MTYPAIIALIAGMSLPAYALAGETSHELDDQFLGHTLQEVATSLEDKGYTIESTEAEDDELEVEINRDGESLEVEVDLASGTVTEVESEHDDD